MVLFASSVSSQKLFPEPRNCAAAVDSGRLAGKGAQTKQGLVPNHISLTRVAQNHENSRQSTIPSPGRSGGGDGGGSRGGA